MSDDEEILCKGKDLYTHLIHQGFSEFETYNNVTKDGTEYSFDNLANEYISDHLSNTGVFSNTQTGCKNIMTSCHDQFRFSSIMKSQLLFKEDIDVINSIVSNHTVSKNNTNVFWYIGFGCATLLSSAMLLSRGSNYYIPLSITLLFSAFTCWEYSKEHRELNNNNNLSSYICTLQGLCSNTHKILRYLKETEFISLPNVTNLKQSNNEIHVDQLPLLPNLRQSVLKSLFDIINTFVNGNYLLKQHLPFWLSEICDQSIEEIVNSKSWMLETEKYISLKDIYLLNELYLLTQSEHLKLIAICISPDIWGNTPDLKCSTIKEVFKCISENQCILRKISFTLMIQFNIHSIPFSENKKVTANKLIRTKSCTLTNNLYLEIHNVFLLMLSLLLRVRSIEDSLDKITEESILSDYIKTTLTKTLHELKNDLKNAEQYFDTIIKEIAIKSIASNNKMNENVDAVSQYKTNETQIVVGSSDFNINSADDVFLAMSGLIRQECDNYFENTYFEKKPIIPKGFMLELSNALKSRKEDFSKREKIAIMKKGIHNVEHDDRASSDEENKPFRNRLNSYDGKPQGDANNTSNRKSKYHSRVLLDEENSTDNERFDDSILVNKCLFTNSSLAEAIAMKSKSWGNTTEECFSDN